MQIWLDKISLLVCCIIQVILLFQLLFVCVEKLTSFVKSVQNVRYTWVMPTFCGRTLIKNANLKTIIENLLISKVKIPNLQIEQFI